MRKEFFPRITSALINRFNTHLKGPVTRKTNHIRALRLKKKVLAEKPTLTAMIRVRNGEEFLRPSVLSVIEVCDEIVIVDNLSTDSTPDIIKDLEQVNSNKVKPFSYDHNVVPVGEEHARLEETDPHSVRLTQNFYNWCLEKCNGTFVLKWDDDMILSERGKLEIADFLSSRFLIHRFGGENLSSDKFHTLTRKAGIENRIFPKLNHTYVGCDYTFVKSASGLRFAGQKLQSWVLQTDVLEEKNPLYIHLKYCKRNPGSTQSPDFRKNLEPLLKKGEPLSEELREDLARYID